MVNIFLWYQVFKFINHTYCLRYFISYFITMWIPFEVFIYN